ncbi:MAG: glycosyltransferase [Candidatus Woesebacteria bacterium]|nr:glycosyltransferase [Candidatus Woesebacteria bacterium]
MAKVSIIIPSCNEIHEVSPGVTVLQRTVQDIYEKATGEIEVIVGFNGPAYQDFPDYPNLRTLKLPENIGLRPLINTLAIMAKGKYIFKSDAHCSFSKGFDEVIQEDIQDNWIVVPRFYVLNGKTWQWQDDRHYDYFYLSCPFTDPKGFRFKAGGHWPERTLEREGKNLIDETPSLHGSGWFIDRDFFLNKIGGFPIFDPYGHGQDSVYLALKAWLGPWNSKLMVNKKVWMAHMHQDGNKRGFHMSKKQTEYTYNLFANYWMGDKWEERVHNIDWFIRKFMPMPTWPENWRELLETWRKENKWGL